MTSTNPPTGDLGRIISVFGGLRSRNPCLLHTKEVWKRKNFDVVSKVKDLLIQNCHEILSSDMQDYVHFYLITVFNSTEPPCETN